MIDIWIQQVCDEHSLVVASVPADVVRGLVADITSIYTVGSVGNFLWEAFDGDESVHLEDAAVQAVSISTFPVYLLYEESSTYYGLYFTSRDNLLSLVTNMPRFEFYLVDLSLDSIICRNHHDYLIAVGAAISRLSKILSDRQY